MDRNVFSSEGRVPALLKQEPAVALRPGRYQARSKITGSRGTNIEWRSSRSLVLLIALASTLYACGARVNWRYPRTPSTAFTAPQTTSVGALFQGVAARHQRLSGFLLVPEDRDAFMARLAMADLAEKTLDAQYFIWESDTTGRILGEHLLRAADRGVRVRVLIDDDYLTAARDLGMIALLDGHPNLKVRFFNPVTNRGSRTMSFIADFGRVNHRMHNKLFVMDNTLAIVGGRNIVDEHFGVNAVFNYRDLDVMAAGPIVADLSAAFDSFWNSAWAIPVRAVVSKVLPEDELREIRTRSEARAAATAYPYPMYQSNEELHARLLRARDRFIWAPAHVFVENPARVTTDASRVIVTTLADRMGKTEHEVSIESPYFVLREQGIEMMRNFTARGGKVRVLTNSAASTDEPPAQAGYANTRKALLQAGVDLYELRPDSNMPRAWSTRARKSTAALHAKVVVFDRQSVWIGSFNLDPRSIGINTEIGLMIDSPELATQVADFMEGGVAPGSAYHVTLDEKGDLLWTTDIDGREVRYHSDPAIGLGRRLEIGTLRLLPIQNEL
jgi:putative cardiolipin synthase